MFELLNKELHQKIEEGYEVLQDRLFESRLYGNSRTVIVNHKSYGCNVFQSRYLFDKEILAEVFLNGADLRVLKSIAENE